VPASHSASSAVDATSVLDCVAAALGGAGESQPGLGRDSESCDNSGRERAKFAASGQPQR